MENRGSKKVREVASTSLADLPLIDGELASESEAAEVVERFRTLLLCTGCTHQGTIALVSAAASWRQPRDVYNVKPWWSG